MTSKLVSRIDHTAIFCADVDKSADWYCSMFDLEVAYRGDVGTFLDVGDTILALLPNENPAADLSQQHFAFAVEDVDATHAELLARGAACTLGPIDLPEGYIAGQRYADIVGPEGERVEIVQRPNIVVNRDTLHPSEA